MNSLYKVITVTSIALVLCAMLGPRYGFRATATVSSAEDILDRSRAMYAGLNSYSDTGVVVNEFGTSSKERHTFTTYFSRAPRGFYFDFLEFKKEQAQWMTPSTPSIAHIHALQSKLDEIFEEGIEARFARHARTNALVHDWVRRSGFDFFAEEGFRSKTLTCVKNNKGIDVLEFARELRQKHHLVIDPGYGKIRGETFRLSNMGDETEESVSHLLACLDDVL